MSVELTAEERIDEYKSLFRRMKMMGLAEPYVLHYWNFRRLTEAVEETTPEIKDSPNYSFNPSSIKFCGYEVKRLD